MIRKILQRLDLWLNNEFYLSDKQLSVYRICYCLLTIFWVGIPNYSWISGHPSLIYNPPRYSIAAVFDSFPAAIYLNSISILVVLLFCCLLFGVFTKQVSILLTASMILGNSFMYSFGKIDHDILFIILPAMMAYSGWGNHYSVDAQQNRIVSHKPWLISLVALVLGFSMWTAGIPKYLHGWLNPSSQAVYGYFIRKYYSNSELALLATFMKDHFTIFIWELMDWLAVIFELGFLLAFLNAKVFRLFVLLAICFHLINGLMINVFFLVNTTVYLLFLPYSYYDQISKWLENRFRGNIQIPYLLLFLGAMYLLYFLCSYFPTSQEVMLRNSFTGYLVAAFSTNGPLIHALILSGLSFIIGISIFFNYIYHQLSRR